MAISGLQWPSVAFIASSFADAEGPHVRAEAFWSDIISTSIEHHRGKWYARKARCCAPLSGGRQCGRPLLETQGLRITACHPRIARRVGPADAVGSWGAAPSASEDEAASSAPIHRFGVRGAWGSRVEQAIRLLLSLRAEAYRRSDAAAAKAVVFSRMEQVLKLLSRACAMNGIMYSTYDAAVGQSECFRTDPAMQVLLLSAHRDSSGLTLTAASHVVIMEPQPDVATELQMIGRVHRIGQARQASVHRLVVEDSFEAQVSAVRQARSSR